MAFFRAGRGPERGTLSFGEEGGRAEDGRGWFDGSATERGLLGRRRPSHVESGRGK